MTHAVCDTQYRDGTELKQHSVIAAAWLLLLVCRQYRPIFRCMLCVCRYSLVGQLRLDVNAIGRNAGNRAPVYNNVCQGRACCGEGGRLVGIQPC